MVMAHWKVPADPLSIEQLETGLILLDEGMLDDDEFWNANIAAFRETVLVAIGETTVALMSPATPQRWRLLLRRQLDELERYAELADSYVTRRLPIRPDALAAPRWDSPRTAP